MFSKTTLALSAAIVISAAFPALAATKHHHRVTHAHSAIYNMVPDTGCPANGGPSCSNEGPAPPDSWVTCFILRRASSFVSSLAADRRPGSSSK